MKGYVPIKTETLTEMANEMRRISGQTDALSPAQMIEMMNDFVMSDGVLTRSMRNYAYEYSSGSTTHSRSYTGTAGNKLLLLVLTRGELVTVPTGWEKIGELVESGDYAAGSVAYNQYVTVLSKVCEGAETIEYEQTESNLSITCIVEFYGVSGFEILENTRMENVTGNNSPEFTCSRTSACMVIWIATTVYFTNSRYYWDVSDDKVWAISDNHGTIQPRLGVFVDNRVAGKDFTIDSSMTASNRYISALCIQVNP